MVIKYKWIGHQIYLAQEMNYVSKLCFLPPQFVEIPNIAMSTIWDSDAVIMGEKHQSVGTAEFYLSTRYTPPPFMARRSKKARLNLCFNLCPPSKQK